MVKTIGNPLSWGSHLLHEASHAMSLATGSLGSHDMQMPQTRRLTANDIRRALRKGYEDFAHFRTDVMFLVLMYPVIGAALVYMAFQRDMLPLIFPMAAGFALLGPLAAVGLYELSRCRERGMKAGWGAALSVFKPYVAAPVLALGFYLIVLFLLWMYAAAWIHDVTMGPNTAANLRDFIGQVLTTDGGHMMILIGMGVGLLFALAALVVSLVSFPMLVDRQVGLPVAVATSLRVARKSPIATLQWGLVVAVTLAVASIPMFLGLVIALPVLGHATWHLYRAAVRFQTPM
ncbi:DUF2189 domain-containing protein [Thalassovita sp.]|uniref:DUF2189 domain-containing protein n=1 Tax=Thalassovita sp. TaxID=1979401 RepID=UPI0029DE7FB8|nr:DUF2189 domain-containing protein [Thalassovita sp.]